MTETKPFSWFEWFGGLLLTLVIGGLCEGLIFLAVLGKGMLTGVMLVVLPALVALAIGSWLRRTAIGSGVITGACVLVLLGGICGSQAGLGG